MTRHLRIDAQSGIRIDQLTTVRIDTPDSVTTIRYITGLVTKNQTALPSHVTKLLSPTTNITA